MCSRLCQGSPGTPGTSLLKEPYTIRGSLDSWTRGKVNDKVNTRHCVHVYGSGRLILIVEDAIAFESSCCSPSRLLLCFHYAPPSLPLSQFPLAPNLSLSVGVIPARQRQRPVPVHMVWGAQRALTLPLVVLTLHSPVCYFTGSPLPLTGQTCYLSGQ